jgi:RNA polymerase sigma-70 factor, ECF subfamily
MRDPSQEVTTILDRLRVGDADAGRELLPLLYDELRTIAQRQFRGQGKDHTLQPTVLVHEAFLKLVGKPAELKDRAHFFAVASMAMRQILVNHARAKNTEKRGSGQRPAILHDALEKLKEIDERKHKVVELRFFAGLTVDEIAQVLDVSKTTIESEWRAARAWLAATMA